MMALWARCRYRARAVPTIVVVVGSLTWGCTGPSGADQPVSAPQPPSLVTTAPTPAARRPTVDFGAMQRQLQRELNGGHRDLDVVRSVLISVEGQTTMAYFHKRKPTEHAHVWSVTKSVISILVGIAVDEGRLRVDQTLQELLPQQASAMTPQQASITLRQLLTMTSGISGDNASLNLYADDTVSQILAYPMGNDPGVAFEYSNSSAHLLAAVLQNAVDQPVLDYARTKLFDPLGIDTRPAWHGLYGSPNSGFDKPGFAWATDRAGINVGGFGLKLTPADMIKLGELYVNDGRWHGEQVVSAAWVHVSTSQQLTPAQEEAAQAKYGYLWWIGEYEEHAIFEASGRRHQKIICLPDVDVVVVVTAADDLTGADTLGLTLDPLLEKVIFKPLLQ